MPRKELSVDNDPYEWDADSISYEQLKELANIPDGVLIFRKVPGQPDEEITPGSTVDLSATPGIDRFSTQNPESGAGE